MMFYSLLLAITLALLSQPVLAGSTSSDKVTGQKLAANPESPSVPPAYIAVIDIQKILREAKASKGLRSQVDDRRRQDRDELSKREDDLRKQQKELEDKKSVLSTKAYNDKVREWEKKAAELNRVIEKRRNSLEESSAKALGEIQAALLKIVHDISLSSNINIVLATSQMLLVEKEMDITDVVMKKIDQVLPKVNLKP